MCMCMHLQAQVSAATSLKTDIIKSLSLYYYTFVDILDFKVCFAAFWLLTFSSFYSQHVYVVLFIGYFSQNSQWVADPVQVE